MSDEIQAKPSDDNQQTNPEPPEFDFARYPRNTLFHERRAGRDRRVDGPRDAHHSPPISPAAEAERRTRKDRRRRIDPTTFEKQYTDDELEFMNAMQRFKDHSGRSFPSHGDVIKVAAKLGYRRMVIEPDEFCEPSTPDEPSLIHPSTVDV